jgi:hypothetical protein
MGAEPNYTHRFNNSFTMHPIRVQSESQARRKPGLGFTKGAEGRMQPKDFSWASLEYASPLLLSGLGNWFNGCAANPHLREI